MKSLHTTTIAIGFAALLAPAQDDAPLRPVPFTDVKLEDEFWVPRIKTCIEKTIPHNFKMCEETGRIRNWDKAAKKAGEFEGLYFNDSDVYKVMEGAAYALHHDPNAKYGDRRLDGYLDELIGKIAAMQWEDGYVNSWFSLNKDAKRWTDIEHKHELYCAGHLIEAAVAHYRVTGKTQFLQIAEKLAANILATFGPGKNLNPCGHPEVELALLKLADAVGELHRSGQPYRELARFFIDQHGTKQGRERLWGDYALDDVPLRERREIAGHAVRAMYLLSAATDLARMQPDTSYVPALDAIWTDLTQRRMYITGGIGNSSHNEGFTVPYDLPNDTAYAETCATIGLVFWAHRMNLLHAGAQYFDVLERALYNGVLAGVSLDGEKFNYTNPLASRGKHRRVPWFDCACCPPNIARLLPTIGGYQYAHTGSAIYVNLFASGSVRIRLHDNLTVTIRQKTDFPWNGKVNIEVEPSTPATFDIYLRRPGWTDNVENLVREDEGVWRASGEPTPGGYIRVSREWKRRTSMVFSLTVDARRVRADPRVSVNRGRVALERGPLVYCFEGVDNDGRVRSVFLPPSAEFRGEHRPDLLGGISVLGVYGREPVDPDAARPGNDQPFARDLLAVPYYAWNNRAPGQMVVWIPESPELVEPPPIAGVTPGASHCYSNDTEWALCDRQEPTDSCDHSIARFTWWPRKGGEKPNQGVEWVQYDFDKPRKVSSVEVYWFDDARRGGQCRAPKSWKLQYRAGDAWRDVVGQVESSRPAAGGGEGSERAGGAPPAGLAEPRPALPFGVHLDRFNRVEFAHVETTALRITAQLADKFSGGILEWRISP